MDTQIENPDFKLHKAVAIDHSANGKQLKAALRTLGGGVSIITAGEGKTRTGATVTSATALSVEPARMLVSLNRSSSTWPVVEHYGHLGVNIIGTGQERPANQFAGSGGLRGPDRYVGADWRTGLSGAPLLVDAVASIDCTVEEAIERHSHVIVIGKVLSVRIGSGRSLLYQDGRYHTVSWQG